MMMMAAKRVTALGYIHISQLMSRLPASRAQVADKSLEVGLGILARLWQGIIGVSESYNEIGHLKICRHQHLEFFPAMSQIDRLTGAGADKLFWRAAPPDIRVVSHCVLYGPDIPSGGNYFAALF